MMQDMGQNAMLLVMILGAVIAVLWIALPFAVFGIKKRLDAILVELRRMNDRAGR
jgi:branched-subunit amino acid transport protein AzlD